MRILRSQLYNVQHQNGFKKKFKCCDNGANLWSGNMPKTITELAANAVFQPTTPGLPEITVHDVPSIENGNSPFTISNVTEPIIESTTASRQSQSPHNEVLTNNSESLQIKLVNFPKTKMKLNVVVHYLEEGARWYTLYYRSYEGKLWHKVPRNGINHNTRWYFICHICEQHLCSFCTIKNHLNRHLGFFPYRCTVCPKRYTTNSSLKRHTQHSDCQRLLDAPAS